MNITPRKNKDGKIISYQIRVFVGRNPVTDKQEFRSATYKPNPNWSDRTNQRALEKFASDFEYECTHGTALSKKEQKEQAKAKAKEERRRPTVKAYIETFLEQKSCELALNTQTLYRNELKKFSEFENMGEKKFADILPCDVKGFINDLQKRGYAISSVKTTFTILHLFFETAIQDGLIDISPMQRIKPPKQSKDKISEEKMRYLSKKQVDTLQNALLEEEFEKRVLFIVMLDTGCRRGEIAALQWKNINLETGEIKVCQNMQYSKEKGGKYVTTTKNRKIRKIILTSFALSNLKKWRVEQAKYAMALNIPCDFVFTNSRTGNPYHPISISQWFSKFGEKAGINGVHPHLLRHTMASLAISNGADILSVSKKLGHSQVSTTLNIYSHATEEAERKTAEILEHTLYDNKQTG